jgi:peroxiredoxin
MIPSLLLAVALILGAQAPDFTLPDQNNHPVALSAARGHKAVLVFYRGYW